MKRDSKYFAKHPTLLDFLNNNLYNVPSEQWTHASLCDLICEAFKLGQDDMYNQFKELANRPDK